ncbi:MAG: tetratricopeptide repeat protein [Chloroflexi bacterium]|nr:MAG: tetratricopeptide repeat protein [Chloroflexota bacterium]
MAKRIILFLILNSIVLISLFAQDQRMSDANIAYLNGDYQTAIRLYEALIADGVQDANVYFNLGNAYYEAGQPGFALVNYRRAQQIAPRDEQINANITLIRAIRVDFQGSESYWLDSLAMSTYTILTLQELGLIALIIWGIFFIALSCRFWGYQWLNRWLILIGVFALMLIPLFGGRYYADKHRPPAVITALSAPVRSGPSESYLVMYELFSAAEVRVLDIKNSWVRITEPNGREGWIPRTAITLIHE